MSPVCGIFLTSCTLLLIYNAFNFCKHSSSKVITGQTCLSHSQFLVTKSLDNKENFVLWIGEKLNLGAEFQQFSRNNAYVRMPEELTKMHLNVSLFPNPVDNIGVIVKVRDRFAPFFLYNLGPSPLDWRTRRLCHVFLTVFHAS